MFTAIPVLTQARVEQVLPPEELAAFTAQLSRPSSFDLEHQGTDRGAILRSAMVRLNVQPVPTRDARLVYRVWVDSKLAVLVTDSTTRSPEDLQREWHDFESVDTWLTAIQEFVHGVKNLDGQECTIQTEDHPEENALAFSCPESKKVWAICTSAVEDDLEAKRITSKRGASLVTSSRGRIAMALLLSDGTLDAEDPSIFSTSDPNERIDALAASLSARYKARYMTGGKA